MALDKDTFITTVTDIFGDIAKKEDGTFPTASEKATALANAIETFIKSGSVKVTVPNLAVSTTGTAAAQTGTATGVTISNGTIS